MTTRTVAVLASDIPDYRKYLVESGFRVVHIKRADRYWLVTFEVER